MNRINLYLTKYEWQEKPLIDRMVDTLNTPVRWAFGGHSITWLKNPLYLVFKEEEPATPLRILGGVITVLVLPIFLILQLLVIPTKWRDANVKLATHLANVKEAMVLGLARLKFGRYREEDNNVNTTQNQNLHDTHEKNNVESGSASMVLQAPTLNGLPLDILNYMYGKFFKPEEAFPSRFICRRFANLQVLKKTGIKDAAVVYAVNQRFTHLVEWFHENLNYPFTARLCAAASRSGNLVLLKWLRQKGCPWDTSTCEAAAFGGYLEILRWAHLNRCPWDEMTSASAAGRGHLEILQWARANGCWWNSLTCAGAAQGGHLEILKWARANGCPWEGQLMMAIVSTCAEAAKGGHLEVLQWARANGCPWDGRTCSNAALKGHLEVSQWARFQGCPQY